MAEQPWREGPWVVAITPDLIEVVSAHGESVCVVAVNTDDETIIGEEDIASAHLIAAAPTLYAACRAAYGELSDGLASPAEVDWACDVLAAAMRIARGTK